MTPGGHACDRTEKDGVLAHLFQRFRPQEIHFRPGVKQICRRKRSRLLGNLQEFTKDWTQVFACALDLGFVEHCAALHEKYPPELAQLLKRSRAERLNVKSGIA